jgi:hypothetical protein
MKIIKFNKFFLRIINNYSGKILCGQEGDIDSDLYMKSKNWTNLKKAKNFFTTHCVKKRSAVY